MIETLSQYLLAEQREDEENLIQQNVLLNNQISYLESRIQQIIFHDHHALPHNDKLDKVLSTLSMPQSELEQQKCILAEQGEHIRNLAIFIEKYLTQEGVEPRNLERKIKELKKLVQDSERNNYPGPQTSKMKKWNQKLIMSLQKRLCDLVSVFSTHLRIRVEDIVCYRDLLNQQICREFVIALHKDIITYDVPTFSYILMVPQKEMKEQGVMTVQRQIATFTCEKAEKYYDQIQQSIKKSEKLCLMLAELFQQQNISLHDCILSQLASSKENIKAQIEYILPYLTLEKRKQLVDTLCTKSQQQSSLYDILVRLRIKGQDGEMMESNIRQLVEKLKSSDGANFMDEVVVFLQICQSEDKALNIGFYVCNELVNRLEGQVDYSQIERLLALREQMRFRIHHPL